jgi:hypothetical protein
MNKHRKLSRIAIVATIVAAGLMGLATNAFAQAFVTRTVQGMFGPRTMGQPTMAPSRLLATGAPVGLNGQPVGFERARGDAVSSSNMGWSFGAPAPNAILPWPVTTMSNAGFPVLGNGSGSTMIGVGGGGGLFPLPPSAALPTRAMQPETGIPPETQGATPTGMPFGQAATMQGQNGYATPGQNAGQVGNPSAQGQNAPIGAQTAAGAAVQPGQAPGAATPGGSMPATPAADIAFPRIPAPWALGSIYIGPPGGVTSGVAVAGAGLTTRLESSKVIQKRSPISVSLDQDTAVIRGRVATEHDRDLATAILRLEPGVDQVRNELVVESPSPASQGAATP